MDKLAVLQRQHQSLAVQLEEKKRESRLLQERVTKLESREQEYGQTLLTVNRCWEQLQDDLQAIWRAAALSEPADAASASANDEEIPSSVADPFLRKLLAGANASLLKEAQEVCKTSIHNAKDLEDALEQRATNTKSMLSSLLSLVQQLQQQAAGAQGKEQDVVQGLQQQLNNQSAKQRLLATQLRSASDRYTEATEKIKQLENELADAEQEIINVQRKLLSLQASGSGGGAAPGGEQQHGSGPGSGAAATGLGAGGLPGGDGSTRDAAARKLGSPTPEDVLDEVTDLRRQLEARAADLEREQEAHVATRKELQETQARLLEESTWVGSTRMYQALAAEVGRLQELLGVRAKELEALARERDAAHALASERAAAMLREAQASAQISELQGQRHSLAQAKAETERRLTECEAALRQERERAAGTRTTAELRLMVQSLQAEVALKGRQAAAAAVPKERLDAMASELAAARQATQVLQLEVGRLTKRISSIAGERDEALRREALAKDCVGDLRAFVDVLSAYCGGADASEVVSARASEAALKAKVEALSAQLEGHELTAKLKAAAQEEQTLKEQLESAHAATDAVRAEVAGLCVRVKELESQLSQARTECELYISEIESTSRSYEETQAQAARLVAQLAEKEDALTAAAAEKLRLSQAISRLEEAIEAGRVDLERSLAERAALQAVREATEREVARLNAELMAVKEQLRLSVARTAAVEQEVRRREEGAAALTSQVEGLTRLLQQARDQLSEAEDRANKDRNKRQRLEEENKSLVARVEKMRKGSTSGGNTGASQGQREMAEEVEAMRKLLTCNVCHERQKNTIITKCCHVFCDRCIKRNLDSRNRKCPGCGIAFGQADVRAIYF